ncbi:uncharacterized protein LOC132255972 [Phlebotomus argentipes]|uniref:uncharacterized protein LOC132255972 n=1 Tax=Phlebotomus argentipes TaxID=94469 RepID=UPI002892BA48|nr:uncharacterized protein LOC132255972 [Phlebotomus argentipes]
MTTPESSLAAFYLRPNQPHKSEVTAEHGHVYQKELFFYLCLVLNNWEECRYWTIGFEVTDLKKFDDIVAEFEVNNEEYSFFIQTKHAAHADKKVTRDHIIPQPGIQQKNKSQEKSFEINQYYEAVVKSKKSPNRTSKFIVLTNSEIDLDETQSTDILTIVDESNAVYCELFRELKDRCERDMKVIKFAKEIPLSGGAKITDAFFLDNFSYISKFPSSQELMIINNVLLSRKYRNFPTKNFFKVRNNVFESLSLEKDSEGKLLISVSNSTG